MPPGVVTAEQSGPQEIFFGKVPYAEMPATRYLTPSWTVARSGYCANPYQPNHSPEKHIGSIKLISRIGRLLFVFTHSFRHQLCYCRGSLCWQLPCPHSGGIALSR